MSYVKKISVIPHSISSLLLSFFLISTSLIFTAQDQLLFIVICSRPAKYKKFKINKGVLGDFVSKDAAGLI